jgi:tripartite-type tricarboxylate transporter receptor subunit TctC
MSRLLSRAAAAMAGAILMPGAASVPAQQFPTRTIRIIVPSAPGGGNDILARQFAARLFEPLGQSVVVENRAGASGNIGAELTARAPADGHTFMIHSNSMAVSLALYPKLNYDPVSDFAPMALITRIPLVLVAHPGVPAKNVKELVALSKKRKGGIDFGSSGGGSISHLAGVLFNDMAKIELTHIPYKGAGLVFSALLGGEVDVAFPSVPSSIEYVRAGKLRALAVTSAKPSGALPDVPTMASYYPGYEADAWYGFFAPAGTPAPVLDRLVREIRKVYDTPDMRATMERGGFEPVWLGPAEFAAFYKVELGKYGKLVKLSGAKPE